MQKNISNNWVFNKFSYFILSLIVFVLLTSCNTHKDVLVAYNNPNLQYQGRIDSNLVSGTKLYWPGTSVKLNFEGTTVLATLSDTKGDNYYNIIVDDSISILRLETQKKQYVLATGLDKGKHSVEIYRRTSWDASSSTFYGFQLDHKAKILPIEKKVKKIEFYGNSISEGYAVEDYTGNDSPDSTYTNNYLSYAALTARHFNADYNCICKGGIGIAISWFPLIMPEMYNRTNPEDKNSKWEFDNYTPDIVVVNLFQNDSWLVEIPKHKQFKARFGNTPPNEEFIVNAYQKFISSLREKYPNAEIICLLGNMDITKEGSKWPNYVDEATQNLKDKKIHTLTVPYKNTPGHPRIEEQKIIADSLIQYIEQNIQW